MLSNDEIRYYLFSIQLKTKDLKEYLSVKSMPLNLALRNQTKPVQATQRMKLSLRMLRNLLIKEACVAVAIQISSGRASNPSAETICVRMHIR